MTRRTRTAAALALSVTAALGLAAPGPAAKKKKLTPTTVTITAPEPGDRAITVPVDSDKTVCIRGRDATLLGTNDDGGGERDLGSRRTDRGGVAEQRARFDGRYRVKVAATASCKAATSNTIAVTGF